MNDRLIFPDEMTFKTGYRILVGLSGGLDSVVLTHMLVQNGASVVAAHCNFQLRGSDSDADEAFVRDFAEKLGVELMVKRFDTLEYAAGHKISIQMAARELRYAWFEELLAACGCTYIAVGHHADDQIETMLMNLMRGSGLQGLRAMKAINGNILRPLLKYRKSDLYDYLVKFGLSYIEDSSNAETKYLRNKIRLLVLPAIDDIDKHALPGMVKSVELLQYDAALYEELIEKERRDLLVHSGSAWHISLSDWVFKSSAPALLYALINPFGFKGDVVQNILQACGHSVGAQFFAKAWRLTITRSELVIEPSECRLASGEFVLWPQTRGLTEPFGLTVELQPVEKIAHLKQPPVVALLDFELLRFPLRLRLFKKGDRFHPFGMPGSKLVSDFLTDLHVSRAEKEKTWILADAADEVVWIVGRRIDGRFAVSSTTTDVWCIRLHTENAGLL